MSLSDSVDRMTGVIERHLERERRGEIAALNRELTQLRDRYERIGSRGEPRPVDFLLVAHALWNARDENGEGLMSQFSRRVPGEFWAIEDDAAVVSCQCGEAPAARLGIPTFCACERAFLYDGEVVRVAFSPADAKGRE